MIKSDTKLKYKAPSDTSYNRKAEKKRMETENCEEVSRQTSDFFKDKKVNKLESQSTDSPP